jgi:hypothetical protein
VADESEKPDRVHLLEQMKEQFMGGDAMTAAVSDMLSLFSFNASVQLVLVVTAGAPIEHRRRVIDRIIKVWRQALLSMNTKAAQAHQALLDSVTDRDHLTWALPDSEDSRVGFMKAVKIAEKRIRDAFEFGFTQEGQLDEGQGQG